MARAKSLAFEIGGEIPELQRGVELALQRLFRNERRRAIEDCGGFFEIDALFERIGLEHQPALVERPARDADLLAGEVLHAFDRCVFGHHRAHAGGIGIERQLRAFGAFPRDPQPVRDDDVGAAALNGDLAGFGRGELRDVELEPGLLVETEGAHDRHLPAGGAGLLQREPQFFGAAPAAAKSRAAASRARLRFMYFSCDGRKVLAQLHAVVDCRPCRPSIVW